ncbi:hypothetical protein L682_17015 [Aquipseudomonas alcaligenes OT 69]|nr:hypothetical protein L682_17015 [Pseudomonas alcaligenes OT 69]
MEFMVVASWSQEPLPDANQGGRTVQVGVTVKRTGASEDALHGPPMKNTGATMPGAEPRPMLLLLIGTPIPAAQVGQRGNVMDSGAGCQSEGRRPAVRLIADESAPKRKAARISVGRV